MLSKAKTTVVLMVLYLDTMYRQNRTAQIASGYRGYQTGDTAYLYSIVEMVPSEDPDYVFQQ